MSIIKNTQDHTDSSYKSRVNEQKFCPPKILCLCYLRKSHSWSIFRAFLQLQLFHTGLNHHTFQQLGADYFKYNEDRCRALTWSCMTSRVGERTPGQTPSRAAPPGPWDPRRRSSCPTCGHRMFIASIQRPHWASPQHTTPTVLQWARESRNVSVIYTGVLQL